MKTVEKVASGPAAEAALADWAGPHGEILHILYMFSKSNIFCELMSH